MVYWDSALYFQNYNMTSGACWSATSIIRVKTESVDFFYSELGRKIYGILGNGLKKNVIF